MRILELCLDCEEEEDPPAVFLEAWLGLLVDDISSSSFFSKKKHKTQSHMHAYDLPFNSYNLLQI